MKTNLFTLISVCLISVSAFGQTADDHQSLKNLIGYDLYEQIAAIGQDRIDAMAYINRHGYYVSDMQGQKDISSFPNALDVLPAYPDAPSLTEQLITSENLDLMGYRFGDSATERLFYRIGDSDKLLVILPMNEITSQLNSKKQH